MTMSSYQTLKKADDGLFPFFPIDFRVSSLCLQARWPLANPAGKPLFFSSQISIPEVLWGHKGISLKLEQAGEMKLNSDMTGKCQRPFTWYHLRKEDNKDEEVRQLQG